MSRVVLFGGAMGTLLLERVVRFPDGSVKTGYVINGGWNFEVRGDEELAKAGSHIVTRRPKGQWREVPIPAAMCGDYNQLITWAEKQ